MNKLQGRNFFIVTIHFQMRDRNHIVNNFPYCFVDSAEPREMNTILSASACRKEASWTVC